MQEMQCYPVSAAAVTGISVWGTRGHGEERARRSQLLRGFPAQKGRKATSAMREGFGFTSTATAHLEIQQQRVRLTTGGAWARWHPRPHFLCSRISPQQNAPRVWLFEGDEPYFDGLLHPQRVLHPTLSRSPWGVFPAA